jgi:hypothetical protein
MSYTSPKSSSTSDKSSSLVVVKMQNSPERGPVWRVCVFIDGVKFIRPGFQNRKPAIKLAAMIVQQGLIHGWHVRWKVSDEKGKPVNINLAALGSKMQRGEKENKNERKTP